MPDSREDHRRVKRRGLRPPRLTEKKITGRRGGGEKEGRAADSRVPRLGAAASSAGASTLGAGASWPRGRPRACCALVSRPARQVRRRSARARRGLAGARAHRRARRRSPTQSPRLPVIFFGSTCHRTEDSRDHRRVKTPRPSPDSADHREEDHREPGRKTGGGPPTRACSALAPRPARQVRRRSARARRGLAGARARTGAHDADRLPNLPASPPPCDLLRIDVRSNRGQPGPPTCRNAEALARLG